jgi:hypothetical protein
VTDGRHVPDDLGPGHEGVVRDPVVVFDGVDVAVTDAAMGDGDADVMLSQSWRCVFEGLEWLSHPLRRISQNPRRRHLPYLLS